jgi:hypothetical protein
LLVAAELWAAMNNAMSDRDGAALNVLPYGMSQSGESIALRFVNLLALKKRFSIARLNTQCASAMADAFRAPGEKRLFVSVASATVIEAKLQRGRAAVQHEYKICRQRSGQRINSV